MKDIRRIINKVVKVIIGDPDSRNPWKTKSPSIQGLNSKNNTIEKGNKI